jgi:hypothetical protein
MIERPGDACHEIFTIAGPAEMYDSLFSGIEPIPELHEWRALPLRKANDLTIEPAQLLE